jgi:predicted DNA binding protein
MKISVKELKQAIKESPEAFNNTLTYNELEEVIQEAYEDGFFEDITLEDIADTKQFSTMMEAFLSELKFKRVIRGKKIFKKVICPKNKKFVKPLQKCVQKSAKEKITKRKAMKKAAIKRRGKMGMILRKRLKSLKKRASFGLK